ncbi:MAG: hypothetical protein ACOX7F_00910 [Eubacteriales bacterium]
MQPYTIGDYAVEFDKAATAAWYEQSPGWHCECGDCRNFLALVGQKQLPPMVTEWLSVFGAIPEKPTYVCELYETQQGHLYQFHYRIAGHMLNDPHPNDSVRFDWGSVYCGHDCYPYGAPNFPEPHFDLMFFMDLPWILNQ